MMQRLKRLARGQWPDRHETWAEYMARRDEGVAIVLACLAVIGVMLLLAEAIDRGLA